MKKSVRFLRLFFGGFLLFFLTQCQSAETGKELDKLQWLEGTWVNQTPTRKSIEVWAQQPDRSYTVNSWLLEGTDTIFSESIEVKPAGQKIIYAVTLAAQPPGEPIEFKLAENTGTRAVFENPEHDFPRKISYTYQPDTAVVVELEGMVNRKMIREAFTLLKQR